jgi:Tfp pilus assembly protein FimV
LSRARITVSDKVIRLRGEVPVLEPMLGLQLVVDCPYTVNLQREYAMFFDFKPAADTRFADTALEVRPTEEVTPRKPAVNGSDNTPVQGTSQKPAVAVVPASSRYQVRPGDSLSGIVARIDDRPAGLWPAAEIIFAANPHAFIDGDINLIKAGSWLEIPDLYAALGTPVSPRVAAPTSNSTPATVTIEPQPLSLPDLSSTEYVPFDSGFREPEPQASAPVENSIARSLPGSGELQPGDVILQGDDPFVTPVDADGSKSGNIASTVVIPDTDVSQSLANPAAQPSVQPFASRGATNGSWTWLAWLGGAGIAVFLGLLLFGRMVRNALDRRRSVQDWLSSVAGGVPIPRVVCDRRAKSTSR